jgi:hypothetical protein
MVLPPDLSRLGDELTGAVARSVEARRRRRALLARGSATAVAGILAVAVLAPAALGPAARTPAKAAGSDGAEVLATLPIHRACDQGRGNRFRLPACGHTSAVTEHVPALPDPRRRYPSRI